MEKINVAVLLGGESVESDISLITGFQVFKALDENKYNKIIIYIDESAKWWKCCDDIEKVGQLRSCHKNEVVLKCGENNLYLIRVKYELCLFLYKKIPIKRFSLMIGVFNFYICLIYIFFLSSFNSLKSLLFSDTSSANFSIALINFGSCAS